MKPTDRTSSTLDIRKAVTKAPILNQLTAVIKESQNRLLVAKTLLPPALFRTVTAGSFENGHWDLLASNSSTANKLRQWKPALLSALQKKGLNTTDIHIKVLKPTHQT